MQGPITFQREALKRTLWDKQKDICRAAVTKRKTSVKGCHGSGKSYVVSGLVPYFQLRYEEVVILTVAPTMRQVKTFWKEIHFAIEASHIKFPDPTTTGVRMDGKNYSMGFSSSKSVNAQGFHGRRVILIADESIGITPDLWDAIEGIRSAGDVTTIDMCNPTVPSGPVFEAHTRLRGEPDRACITISAFDTPNLQGLTMETLLQLPEDQLDIAPVPWLTRRRWVKEMYFKWGPTNPRFQARVLGQFPTQASNSVFSLAWIEAAALPWEEEDLKKKFKPGLWIQIGIDVAGPGDDETACCARLGGFVVAQAAWSKSDPLQEVLMFIGKLQQRFPQVPVVIVGDTVGIGYHFMRAIARNNYDVRGFVAGASPVDPVMFVNAKAEGYWALRDHMQAGNILGIEDEDTKAQLSDVRYQETASGRIEIEHKDDARKRGSSSPDRAEALVMAFVRLVPKQQTVDFTEAEVISRI